MLGAREFSVPHVFGIGVRRARDLIGQVGVPLHELRRLAGRQPEHVVQDEHLPVGAGAGADADGRDAQRLSDGARELAGHSLQHDAEGSRLLQGFRVSQDPGRLRVRLALDLEPAHLVDELRRQAEMAHDRDAELGQPARDLDHVAALELDRVHPGLLEEPARGCDCLLD